MKIKMAQNFCEKGDTDMPMGKANADVRMAAWSAGVPLWKVAVELGVNEMTISRWMRAELPVEKKERILTAIQKLANAGG